MHRAGRVALRGSPGVQGLESEPKGALRLLAAAERQAIVLRSGLGR